MFRQLIARAFETVRHWCPVVGVRSLALATVVAVAAIAAARGQNPLVAHYNFDDSANTYTTGGTIFDVSGNDFNGTVINAALTHNATGGVSGGSMNAVSSGSASFTTSYASSPVAADNFTLMFWVKAGGPSSNSLDFGQINYSNGSSGQLRSTTGQLLYYRHVVTSNQTFQFGPVGGATIVDNSGSGSVWKQIAFMADSATGEYGWYVDGGTPFFSAFPATDNPFTADTTVTGLQMGRSQWAVSRTGQIDEVQLYDRSLTQTEVQLLFANPGYGGTNFRVWEPTAASNSWTAAADWQGLGAAAAPGVTGDPASASADVAILKNYAFSGGLGIDMSAAGADGSLALGGISFNSASGPLRIGNSAADTTGTLRLNGGLVDSVANTILKVAGASDLTIGNSASGSGTQTMAVELAKPQNVVDVAASRTLTIESAISQSGGGSLIQKTGSGTLVLSGANTFTGGTTISAGTLEVASIADSGTSNLGTAGSLAIGGGTLRYTGSGAQSTTRDLSIDGVAATIDVVSPTGSLTFSSSGGTRTASLTKAGSGSLAIDGGFSGSAGITVAAGTLALGAAGTHSGPTSVAAGATLELADGAALQNSGLSAPVGATVSLTAVPGGTYTIGSISGAAALDATASTLAVGSNNASTIYLGDITAAAFEKQGTGTLTLTGSNTLGSVDVQGGLLVAASAGAIGNAPITISGGTFRNGLGGSLANPVTLSGAAAGIRFDFGADAVDYLIVGGGGGGDTAVSGVYGSGGGGGAVIEGFALSLAGNSHAITVGGGGQSGTPPINGGGSIATAGGGSTAFGVTANGGQAGATTAVGQGGASGSGFAGGLRGSPSTQADTGGGGGAGGPGTRPQPLPNRKGGDGGPGLSSDITGTVTWYGGGGAGGISYAVGTQGGPTLGGIGGGGGYNEEGLVNTGGGGGALKNGGSGIVIVRYAGTPAATGGTIDTVSMPGYTLHTFADVGTSLLEFSPSATMASPIGGSGGFTFDSVGTLELTGNNSSAGGTIISRGTLVANSATALGSGPTTVRSTGSLQVANTAALRSTALVTETGATISLTGAGSGAYSIGSLAGGGTIAGGANDIAVGGSGTSTTFAGAATANRLVKEGAGTLTLTGANAFQAVEVTAGTLVAASAGAIGNAPITISGGTFRNGVGGGGLSNPVTLSGVAANITFDFGADALEYLVVGGGGGPGGAVSGQAYNGGGGGGGVQAGSFRPAFASESITVGTGGGLSTPGGSSTAFGVTAAGGGQGVVTGQGGSSGNGFAGAAKDLVEAGGGGGAGGVGLVGIGSPQGSRIGGNGGPGVASDITGTTTFFGGGGAGGGGGNGPGTGGQGGGAGRNGAARANSGGGGSGQGVGFPIDHPGADGIVIVRYAGAPAATGGSIDTASVPGYTLHTFAANGTLEFSPTTTMSGPIGGSGGFTLDSVGTLTLSANNTYQGGTIISAGTLVAGHSAALGSGAVTVNPAGRLRLDPGSVIANEVTDLGSVFFAGSLEFAGGGLARTSTAGNATLGTLLAGSAGAATSLNPNIDWLAQTGNTASDIMRLTNTSGTAQVLSLSYAPGLAPDAAQDVYLGWFDPTSTAWVNAIDGNFGGASSFFQGSWVDYLSATPGATPASALGVYGHDPASSTVWAVVNHNSDFAVIVVPEPGTLALAGLGLTAAIATGLRHRQRGAGHSACQRV